MPTSRLEIDLSAIERNLALVRSVIGSGGSGGSGGAAPATDEPGKRPPAPARVGICAVVKQDAYGAGAVRIAKRLAASGADMLSVYTIDEARPLAEAVHGVPILVLMPVHGVDRMDPLYRHAAAGRVHLTVHGTEQLDSIAGMAARLGIAMPVHVQVDTGMSRGGVSLESNAAADLVHKVLSTPRVRLAGLMTHFASPCCDDAFTRSQALLFRDFVESVKPAVRAWVSGRPKSLSVSGAGRSGDGAPKTDLVLHAANSCAVFRSRNLHGSMVRVGQALLGYLLGEGEKGEGGAGFEFAAEAARLEPALRWTSSVAHLSEIAPGRPVGYGSEWRAPRRPDARRTRIALVPVGYADGYPRNLGGRENGGPGWVGFTGRAWDRRGSAEPDGREGSRDHGIVGSKDRRASPAGESADAALPPVVYAPVVGRVSMDQITVDVTDVPERFLACGHGGVDAAGPEVEVYSRVRGAPNFLPAMAAAAGTITHELLCRIGARVERVYRYPAVSAVGESKTIMRQPASVS